MTNERMKNEKIKKERDTVWNWDVEKERKREREILR